MLTILINLAMVVVGAFEDGEIAKVAGLRAGERPLAILAVGRR